MKKKIITANVWDWKESPNVRELQKLLKPFGLNVYPDPTWDGSDSYGFVFTNSVMTKKQLQEWVNKHWGIEDEDR